MEIDFSSQSTETPRVFVQHCGYAEIHDSRSGTTSYVRRLNRDFYPRFHLYIHDRDGKIVLRLHLDQKKASYEGTHAHGGEYDGALVENEAERIRALLNIEPETAAVETEEKKSFWSKLFG